MIDHLFPYYERELRFINLLTREFAQRHPAAAARLGLEATGSSDPYVQRLLESFALIAGRTHAKIEDDYPELTDALLQFLYPHFLAPIPSMAVVELEADPARVQLPRGFRIAAGSVIEAATEPIRCKYRTAYPVTLWPIRVLRASFRAPPFPPGLRPPESAVAALRLELECVGELSFAQLELEVLRFFLCGDAALVPELHEVLLNHALQVVFAPERSAAGRSPVLLDAKACLKPVGFGHDEGLLPYPENARMGYRLMTEFFAFPAKFQFIDLAGWAEAAPMQRGHRCEIVIFCAKNETTLEQGVDAGTFRLGCTPVVNLFTRTAEPIPLRPRQSEYRIVADRMSPDSMEVYSVTQASSTDPAENRTTVYPPFHALTHARGPDDGVLYFQATRRRSLEENDQGTEVFLSLVNLDFEPRWPADEELRVQVLCTNRDVPRRIGEGDTVGWSAEFAAPLQAVRCLWPPSPPLRPSARAGGAWEWISHLSPSPLSLQEGDAGRAALLDMLRLYDFSDPAAGEKHLRDQALQIVDGVLSVQHRRVLGRIPGDPRRGLCRGIEITVELDPAKLTSRGAYLFAAVLDRFFGLFATSNSFTQLIARTPNGVLAKWPARTGEIPLL